MVAFLAVTTLTVRNPPARWLTYILGGLAFGLVSLNYLANQVTTDDNGNQRSLMSVWLYVCVPITLAFVLTGLFSARAKVVVGPDGVYHNGLLEKHDFRWDEVSGVRVVVTRHSVNLIPTGTTHEVRLCLANGKELELPAPHARGMIGKAAFRASAQALHEAVQRGKAMAAGEQGGRPTRR